MFTGIIEGMGKLEEMAEEGSNLRLCISWDKAQELRVDQSLAHNGICLTVEDISGDKYQVTAVEETVKRSNLGRLKSGDLLNLERSMQINSRLDGHMVQGHVDGVAEVKSIKEADGSWYFTFNFNSDYAHLLVEKGSVCLNGVSLTVVECNDNHFSAAIIPYTFEHTNFSVLQKGDAVNVEFDILGKYIARQLAVRGK